MRKRAELEREMRRRDSDYDETAEDIIDVDSEGIINLIYKSSFQL